MKIDCASLEDIPQIKHIVNVTWPHTYSGFLSGEQIAYMLEKMYSEDVLSHQFMHPDHSFFLAKEDGAVLGFAGIQRHCPEEGQVKLHKIYVLPEAQGKNVGRRLIEEIITVAKNDKQTSILLNVNRYNKAKDFYERLGFSVIKEENIDIGNGFLMEDYVMKMEL